jgi:hypothetical protein
MILGQKGSVTQASPHKLNMWKEGRRAHSCVDTSHLSTLTFGCCGWRVVVQEWRRALLECKEWLGLAVKNPTIRRDHQQIMVENCLQLTACCFAHVPTPDIPPPKRERDEQSHRKVYRRVRRATPTDSAAISLSPASPVNEETYGI